MYRNNVPTRVMAAVRIAGFVALIPFLAVSIRGFGCTLEQKMTVKTPTFAYLYVIINLHKTEFANGIRKPDE